MKYDKPELEVLEFINEDVITTSQNGQGTGYEGGWVYYQ